MAIQRGLVDLNEIVYVRTYAAAALDLDDGGQPVYLIRFQGQRFNVAEGKPGDEMPAMIYGLDLSDLSSLIRRLIETVVAAGDGEPFQTMFADWLVAMRDTK